MRKQMSKRIIPYGYCCIQGNIEICDREAAILKEIFETYLNGKSLLDIANRLNREGIEYQPGITGWHRSRIMRLIDDKRYMGSESYPAVISPEMHERLAALKESRYLQKGLDRNADIYKLKIPVLCPKCGAVMRRMADESRKYHRRWVCTARICKAVIPIEDSKLLNEITDILNTLISEPKIIEAPAQRESEPGEDVRKAVNEIKRMFDSRDADKAELKKEMYQCVSLKYRDLDHKAYAIRRMKTDFEKSSPFSSYPVEFAQRNIKAILLETDGTVKLKLINDQII